MRSYRKSVTIEPHCPPWHNQLGADLGNSRESTSTASKTSVFNINALTPWVSSPIASTSSCKVGPTSRNFWSETRVTTSPQSKFALPRQMHPQPQWHPSIAHPQLERKRRLHRKRSAIWCLLNAYLWGCRRLIQFVHCRLKPIWVPQTSKQHEASVFNTYAIPPSMTRPIAPTSSSRVRQQLRAFFKAVLTPLLYRQQNQQQRHCQTCLRTCAAKVQRCAAGRQLRRAAWPNPPWTSMNYNSFPNSDIKLVMYFCIFGHYFIISLF